MSTGSTNLFQRLIDDEISFNCKDEQVCVVVGIELGNLHSRLGPQHMAEKGVLVLIVYDQSRSKGLSADAFPQ